MISLEYNTTIPPRGVNMVYSAMKLLIHGCCADCTLKFIESVKEMELIKDMVIYFYNPNIHPRSEYQSRLKAIKIVTEEKKIKLVLPDWKPAEYFDKLNSSVPVGGSPFDKGAMNKKQRCINCWQLRLEETAKYAKQNRFSHFSSTLITSQYQDSEKVVEIGRNIAKKYDLKFVVPTIVYKDLSTSGFYKQTFCGCCYSLVERLEEKF